VGEAEWVTTAAPQETREKRSADYTRVAKPLQFFNLAAS